MFRRAAALVTGVRELLAVSNVVANARKKVAKCLLVPHPLEFGNDGNSDVMVRIT